MDRRFFLKAITGAAAALTAATLAGTGEALAKPLDTIATGAAEAHAAPAADMPAADATESFWVWRRRRRRVFFVRRRVIWRRRRVMWYRPRYRRRVYFIRRRWW